MLDPRGAPREIALIGAGIGGLTAAVALRQAGFDVDVYEQAPELTEVGGGINMGPNAARILYRLGLGAALDREAVRPASTRQRRWQDGRTLQQAPLNPLCEELYGAPHLTVHRAALLSIIEAWFENGARATTDLLVGADGILRRYERLRLPRVSRLQEMSRANRTRFHLPDGPAQEQRDAEWRRAGDRSPEALRWLYGFDAAAVEPPAPA